MQSASAPRRRRHRRRRRARRAPRPRYHLAQAGLDVLLLEKTAFPREKVCGDGLTPRAVKAAGRDGHRHPRGGRLDPQPGPAHHRRRACGSSCPWPDLAELPRLRPGPPAPATSTRCSPGTRGKAGARLRERTTGHRRRCSTSAPAAIAGVDAPRRRPRPTAGETSPTARRSSSPPTATPAGSSLGAGHRASATTARWASPSAPTTRSPRHDDDWLESWLELWDGEPTATRGCCPATAGSSASATAPATSASASSTPARPSARSTTGRCCAAGSRPMPRGVGLHATRTAGRPDPRRRAADGLQPAAALRPRAAARRRRRRHGQPVQRRGHRLRDGVRRARRRGHRARRWPGRRPTARERALQAYPQALKQALRRLLHARPALRAG